MSHPLLSLALLSLDGLSLNYGTVPAVRAVSFDLHPGETLSVVGESGSGKSSLIRTALGLVPATAGTVRFDGREVKGLRGREAKAFRRDAQMIFQDPAAALSPRMTVRNLLAEPLRIHGVAERSAWPGVLDLLRRVGLPESVLDKHPHQISGGQARRVGIARALVLRPRLLVADEPTAGLDLSVQGDIVNLLAGLQSDFGLTILMVSHNLDVVRAMSDRVLVLYLGRAVEVGPAEHVLNAPAHPYTRALLAAVPRFDPGNRHRAPPLPGEVPSPRNPPSGCAFHPRCPLADARCRIEEPAEHTLADGHRVACHHPLHAVPAAA
ncbi:ABC transporter ATP-binding protein [Azospirillum largimobile]